MTRPVRVEVLLFDMGFHIRCYLAGTSHPSRCLLSSPGIADLALQLSRALLWLRLPLSELHAPHAEENHVLLRNFLLSR